MLMFKFEHKLFLKHKIAEFETLEKEDIGKFFFFIQPASFLPFLWGFLLVFGGLVITASHLAVTHSPPSREKNSLYLA